MKLPAILLILACSASAAPLQSAKITQAVNDVKVYTNSSSPRPAAIGETIRGSNSISTGRNSRVELVFADGTITRLGQNSVFRFREGTRDLELTQGSVLLQVPKTAGGATIRTATVTAAITGTTTMFEFSPNQWVKQLTLEGKQKLTIPGLKDPTYVPAGQMIVMHPNGRVIPQPITIDLAKLLASSILAGEGTFGPLPGPAREAIAETIRQQMELKRKGRLLPTRQIVSGPGIRGGRGLADIRQPNQNPEPMLPVDHYPGGDCDDEGPGDDYYDNTPR